MIRALCKRMFFLEIIIWSSARVLRAGQDGQNGPIGVVVVLSGWQIQFFNFNIKRGSWPSSTSAAVNLICQSGNFFSKCNFMTGWLFGMTLDIELELSRYNIGLFLCTYLLPMVGLLLSYLQVSFCFPNLSRFSFSMSQIFNCLLTGGRYSYLSILWNLYRIRSYKFVGLIIDTQ